MILGALLELGVPPRVVRQSIAGLGIRGVRMRVSKVKRGSIAACYVSFSGPARDGAQRRFSSIRKLIERASLSDRVRDASLRVFRQLAASEARVHGVSIERVHFHEVGAVDALGDIVGVCAALEHLGVDRLTASPLALGRGTVDTDHGRLPLPAPATLELLKGIPTYPAEVEWETVTPTGAALLAGLADGFGPMPPITPSAQGFGAGDDRAGPVPNVVRGILGTPEPALAADMVSVLETNLDDMSAEELSYLIDRMMEAGALDASLSALAMKKGRPGHLLRVIARPADRDALARRILLESTAIGVRYHEMQRLKLLREQRRVSTRFGRIPVKVVRTPDGRLSASAEHDACARAARKHGVPLREVCRAAEHAAREQLD